MKQKTRKRRQPTLDELEASEHVDWLEDLKRREYKLSKKYKEGKKLAESYKVK